jgi:hypothetical protein
LRGFGLKSKRDLAKMQAQFNAWAKETGLGYVQLSKICALSMGENYTLEELRARMGDDLEVVLNGRRARPHDDCSTLECGRARHSSQTVRQASPDGE